MNKTIFLSIWHWTKKLWWWIDPWACANWVTEFAMAKYIVDWVISKWVSWFKLVKVPEWLSLPQKITYINKNCKDWDIAIELHLDSAPNANWCSTWYMSESNYAKTKAVKFQMKYTEITWIKGKWVKWDLTNRLWRLWFVRDTIPLSLLIELGFITSTSDIASIRNKWIEWVILWLKQLL